MIKRREIMLFVLFLFLFLFYGSFSNIPLLLVGKSLDTISKINKEIYLIVFDCSFIIYAVYAYRITLVDEWIKFKENPEGILKTAFIYWTIGVFLMILSNYLISVFVNMPISENEDAVRDLITKVPLYMSFYVILYSPIIEELLFRKSLRNAVRSEKLYIFLSGFIFGFLHVAFSSGGLAYLFIIPYAILGWVFAALYVKTDSIYSTIFIHMFHNGFLFIAQLALVIIL